MACLLHLIRLCCNAILGCEAIIIDVDAKEFALTVCIDHELNRGHLLRRGSVLTGDELGDGYLMLGCEVGLRGNFLVLSDHVQRLWVTAGASRGVLSAGYGRFGVSAHVQASFGGVFELFKLFFNCHCVAIVDLFLLNLLFLLLHRLYSHFLTDNLSVVVMIWGGA